MAEEFLDQEINVMLFLLPIGGGGGGGVLSSLSPPLAFVSVATGLACIAKY